MFYDIYPYKSYEDFLKHKEAPYQGTVNVFPLGSRRYSARHWRLRDDGRIDIYYATRTTTDRVEKGEGEPRHDAWIKRRRLASVYPDNTVEFLQSSMGDNALLSRTFGVHICNDEKRGGAILKAGNNTYPLFKGQKFRMGTFECITPYEVFQRRVNKKLAAEAMKQYDEFLRIFPVLIAPLDGWGLRQVSHDIIEELKRLKNAEDTGWNGSAVLPWRKLESYFFEAVEKKHYVDAAVYFALTHDVIAARWTLFNGAEPGAGWVERFKDALPYHVRDRLTKEVYYAHDAFNLKPVEHGYLPSSTWRMVILAGGKPVERL